MLRDFTSYIFLFISSLPLSLSKLIISATWNGYRPSQMFSENSYLCHFLQLQWWGGERLFERACFFNWRRVPFLQSGRQGSLSPGGCSGKSLRSCEKCSRNWTLQSGGPGTTPRWENSNHSQWSHTNGSLMVSTPVSLQDQLGSGTGEHAHSLLPLRSH